MLDFIQIINWKIIKQTRQSSLQKYSSHNHLHSRLYMKNGTQGKRFTLRYEVMALIKLYVLFNSSYTKRVITCLGGCHIEEIIARNDIIAIDCFY